MGESVGAVAVYIGPGDVVGGQKRGMGETRVILVKVKDVPSVSPVNYYV